MKNRYEETKRTLREMIQEGTIKILQPQKINNKYACYFCLRPIQENLIILQRKADEEFYVHKNCYLFSEQKIYSHDEKIN
ncbi:MAG TPA: hypothetical protein VJB35_04090 [Candidatus Nanoarchaeia archaeon]|nr:hypothetical protein [Candidatus Nanoarchaeia archaeon]